MSLREDVERSVLEAATQQERERAEAAERHRTDVERMFRTSLQLAAATFALGLFLGYTAARALLP